MQPLPRCGARHDQVSGPVSIALPRARRRAPRGLALAAAAAAAATLAGACADPEPAVLVDELFAPTALGVDGDRVLFLEASGALGWVSRDGQDRGVLAPGAFTPRPGQIAIEPDSLDLAVGPDQLAWTDHLGPGARLWTMPRGGGAPELQVSLALGRITDVAWHGQRLCWLEPLAVRCVDGPGAPARTVAPALQPRALALASDAVYWLEGATVPRRSGDGRLVTAPLAGGDRAVLAELLHDPAELVIVGEQAFWLDGGSCTDGPSGCIGNVDGALRRVRLSGGAAITQAGGHAAVGGLVAVDDDVYFCAGRDVWRARGISVEAQGVGRGCQVLAAGEGELFLATFDAVVRVPL